MLKLSGFMRPYRFEAVVAPLLMVLEVAMDLAQPRFLQQIVDVGIAQGQMAIVIRTGILMIGCALMGAFGGVSCTVFAVKASQGFGADLRSSLFRKVQSLSFGNLDKLGTGQTVTRLTNDVNQVQNMIFMLLRIMIRAPMMLVGSLILAVVTSPRLSLILVGLMPVLIVVLILVVGKAHPLFSKVQSRLDAVNSVIQENLAGIRVVKAYVRAFFEIKRFGKVNDRLMEMTIRATRFIATVMPVMILVLNLSIVGVVWYGGVHVKLGTVTVGQIMAFVNYLMGSLRSLMMVGMMLVHFSRAGASADRIREVFDSRPSIIEKPRTLSAEPTRGLLVFDDVTFTYDGNAEDPVISNVSFTAEPGETVAILGATGSGKSSLVHLIPRFYDVTSGRVSIDGVDVRDMEQQTLRRRIGVVLQESILFSGTIADNIRYGRPEASDEEVEKAAGVVMAHGFISDLPDQYDTLIGQRGVNLSGGQKQRIAIARALVTDPLILILDDCTSAVDFQTEAQIQKTLGKLPQRMTRLVITQRISTVLDADRIIVLEDGRIESQGIHAELMDKSLIYREIFESQLGRGT